MQGPRQQQKICEARCDRGLMESSIRVLVLTSLNSIKPHASSDAENAAGKLSFRKSAAA